MHASNAALLEGWVLLPLHCLPLPLPLDATLTAGDSDGCCFSSSIAWEVASGIYNGNGQQLLPEWIEREL